MSRCIDEPGQPARTVYHAKSCGITLPHAFPACRILSIFQTDVIMVAIDSNESWLSILFLVCPGLQHYRYDEELEGLARAFLNCDYLHSISK